MATLLPILAACASGNQDTLTEGEDPSLSWETSYADGTVTAKLEDQRAHYRVDRVALLGPGGQTITSTELTRETLGEGGYGRVSPSVGVGGGYSSRGGFGTGIGLGLIFPLGGSGGAEPEARVTTARFRLPNPTLYEQTAARWQVEAALTNPEGENRFARFPAPVPELAAQPLPEGTAAPPSSGLVRP